MEVKVRRKSGDIILTVTIPAERVKEVFAEIKRDALKEVSTPGFRKGKVPKAIAEKRLNEDVLAEALFNQLIPPTYAEALKKEKVRPIVPPQLKVTSYQKDSNLVFEAKTAERPVIELGNYKAALKKLKGKVIFGPDGKPLSARASTQITAKQVLEKLREVVDLTIPSVLIEREVQRMLSSLLKQVQTLGITIDQYLAAEGKTVDRLREEYRETAEKNLKDEFTVSEITQKENIEISSKEVDEAVAAAPDEKARKAFKEGSGRQYITNILRQRKTIEYLLKLAESD